MHQNVYRDFIHQDLVHRYPFCPSFHVNLCALTEHQDVLEPKHVIPYGKETPKLDLRGDNLDQNHNHLTNDL